MCGSFNDSSHLEKTKKSHDNPLEGRVHVSGHIQQVFKESIDHVDEIEVSETRATDLIQMFYRVNK